MIIKWTLKLRAERFCAKLNDGLTAVAVVLAMLVFMVGTYRTLETVATAPLSNDTVWDAAPADASAAADGHSATALENGIGYGHLPGF